MPLNDNLADLVAYNVSGDVAATENWPAIRDAIRKRAQEAVEAEREACAKLAIAKSSLHTDCDYRGAQDLETGEIPCGRRDGCLCDDLAEHGDAIAKAIRNRKA